MATLVSEISKPRSIKIVPREFNIGQKVRLSQVGRESLKSQSQYSTTGTVAKPAACYPDSVAVVRDGSKCPLQYHWSYWEPV